MKLSSERTEVLLHRAVPTPLLQPRMPELRSPVVRVALQTSVWACAGAAMASSAVAASRARQASVAAAVRSRPGLATAPGSRKSPCPGGDDTRF